MYEGLFGYWLFCLHLPLQTVTELEQSYVSGVYLVFGCLVFQRIPVVQRMVYLLQTVMKANHSIERTRLRVARVPGRLLRRVAHVSR